MKLEPRPLTFPVEQPEPAHSKLLNVPRRFVWITRLFVLLAAVGSLPTVKAHSTSTRTEANVPIEITFTAQKPHDDPFNTVQVDVRFTEIGRAHV